MATVVFIPSAPLILPALNPQPLPAHARLRDTILTACEPVRWAAQVVVVGGPGVGQHPDAGDHEPGLYPYPVTAPGCEAQFDGTATGFGDAREGLPLSLTVGRWAAQHAGQPESTPTTLLLAIGSPSDIATTTKAAGLALTDDTVMLVVGDGTATRHEKAPGHIADGSVQLDDSIAEALENGDGSVLRGLTSEMDQEYLLDGRCAWQAAAGLLAAAGMSPVASTLIDYTDPHHVAYFVGRWQVESATST